jgi:hypothetical protein
MYYTRSIMFNEQQLKEVETLFGGLGNNAKVCVMRAINRTMVGKTKTGGSRKDIKDIMLHKVNLQSEFFKKGFFGRGFSSKETFEVEKADWTKLVGIIRVQGANIPMIYYSNQRGERAYTPGKISVQVLKNRGPYTLKHAFIPKLRSGYKGIFETVTPKVKNSSGRNRIREMYGPRIPDLLTRHEIYDTCVEPAIKERLDENLNEEVDAYLAASASGKTIQTD